MTDTQTTVPSLPDGVRFYSLSGTAETWEAYDALIEDDGWEERSRTDENGQVHVWKWRDFTGPSYTAVHTPHEPRTGMQS